jgi:hypothetical protein
MLRYLIDKESNALKKGKKKPVFPKNWVSLKRKKKPSFSKNWVSLKRKKTQFFQKLGFSE